MKEIIEKQLRVLPRTPGVYMFHSKDGEILYVGKATVLKTRVSSYFQKKKLAFTRPIEEVIDQIEIIDVIKTDTVIEALLLEAELIKKHSPKYNVLGRDGRSYLYVGITKNDFPKVLLLRGKQFENGEYDEKKDFVAVFGPYTSATSIREVLKLVRKIFPFSTCEPPKRNDDGKQIISRPCFNRGIGLCPGVCTGEIGKAEYRATIRLLIKFFQGKKKEVLLDLKKEMKQCAEDMDFEKAARVRNQIYAIEHIEDIAVIKSEREDVRATHLGIDIFSRIEGYDISNISGTHAVGSMVVFENGNPANHEYRTFAIKTVEGSNDVAMLEEVIRRRLNHVEWPLPTLLLIDGGLPQTNRVRRALIDCGVDIPVVGIAKGAARKKNQFIIPKQKKIIQEYIKQVVRLYPHILIALRDESHRFAQNFYRKKHRRSLIQK